MIEAVNLTKYYPPPIKSLFDLKSLRDFLKAPREEIPALINITFKVKERDIRPLGSKRCRKNNALQNS